MNIAASNIAVALHGQQDEEFVLAVMAVPTAMIAMTMRSGLGGVTCGCVCVCLKPRQTAH